MPLNFPHNSNGKKSSNGKRNQPPLSPLPEIDQPPEPIPLSEPSQLSDSEPSAEQSPAVDKDYVRASEREAKRLYIILLVIGLAIGALTAVGIVAAMRHFGLTDVPAQVEPE